VGKEFKKKDLGGRGGKTKIPGTHRERIKKGEAPCERDCGKHKACKWSRKVGILFVDYLGKRGMPKVEGESPIVKSSSRRERGNLPKEDKI